MQLFVILGILAAPALEIRYRREGDDARQPWLARVGVAPWWFG